MKKFNEFINEKRYYPKTKSKMHMGPPILSSLEKFAKKIVTKINFPGFSRDELKREREYVIQDLKYEMKLSDDTPVKFGDLQNHPNFDKLNKSYKLIILSLSGPKGRSKNKKFIKQLLTAFRKFPDMGVRDEGAMYYLTALLYIKRRFDEGTYPNYDFLAYSDRKALHKIIPSWELHDTLPAAEIQYIQKAVKPSYEMAIKMINDGLYYDAINEDIGIFKGKHSDEVSVAKNIKRMPELFEFIKQKINDEQLSTKDWKSFVAKKTMTKSEHSDVVSSSFSTSYYYDVEVKFLGRTFNFKDVILGSSYYSGGWN